MAVVSWFLFACTVLGIAYVAVATAITVRFANRPPAPEPAQWPSVTVLKAVSGAEEGLFDALASFCDQQYAGEYEVVFCFHRDDDPAIPIARQVMATLPHFSGRISIGDNPAHRNPKIANISAAAKSARGDIVVIADSDIHVGRDYLSTLAAEFAEDARIGAVTCLYRGIPRRGFFGQLGAAYVEEQFAPSVLVTVAFGTLRFCLGATMAVRRSVLEALGGVDALGPFLADDHKLGELVAAQGSTVELSRYVVATAIPEETLADLWSHELRWARTTFVLAPVGYAFSFVMYPLPLATLYLLASQDVPLGLTLVGAAFVARLALHYVARYALDVRRADAPWIIPVRDFLSAAEWLSSLFGRTVRWRQSVVSVESDGQLADSA